MQLKLCCKSFASPCTVKMSLPEEHETSDFDHIGDAGAYPHFDITRVSFRGRMEKQRKGRMIRRRNNNTARDPFQRASFSLSLNTLCGDSESLSRCSPKL